MKDAERRALGAVLALTLAAGLCGIRWGLPGVARLAAFPDRLKPSPAVAERMAAEWAKLYAGIKAAHETPGAEEPVAYAVGLERVPAGWDFPPAKLLNSYRSMLLQTGHPDEKKSFIILSQMRPWRLEFKPLYVQYGGAFIYPLGAFLGISHLFGLIHLSSGMTYYLQDPAAMGDLFLAGRAFMLVFQLGTVALLFLMTLRLSKSLGAACGASLLVALTPFALFNSHMVKPHPYSAFWAIAACWFLMRSVADTKRRDYLLCGACAGVAAGSLFTLLPILFLPLAGVLVGKKPARDAWFGVGLAVLVLVSLNPFVLFAFKDFRWDFAYASTRPVALSVSQLLSGIQSTTASLGVVATLIAVLGTVSLSFSRAKEQSVLARGTLLLFAVLYVKFAVFFTEDPAALRLFYVPVLLSFVTGAVAAASVKTPKLVKASILAVVLLETTLRGSVALANLHLDSTPSSTFARAAAFVDKTVPSGAAVGLSRYPEPSHTPSFRWDLHPLVVFQHPSDLDGKPMPDWVVVDAMDAPAFDAWNAGRYRVAADFSPYTLGPVTPAAYSPFVNQLIRVYEKSAKILP